MKRCRGNGFLTMSIFVILYWALFMPPGPSRAAEPVRIAGLFAQSGIAAEDNRPALNAATLMVEEIKAVERE